MQKIIIACLFLAVVFAGCSKPSHTESRAPGAGTEPSITGAQKDMDKEFEEKVSQIDQIGKEVIENIRTEASKAISDIQNAATTTTIPEPKEVKLDILSETGKHAIEFKSVKIDYKNKVLIFQIETSKGAKYKYSSMDQNKNVLETAYGATDIWVSGGEIENYSTVFITYQVADIDPTTAYTDPVTVEIEIPGL